MHSSLPAMPSWEIVVVILVLISCLRPLCVTNQILNIWRSVKMHQRLRNVIIAVAALALSLALCAPAGGQVIKGSISGTVTDPQGAAVSGASVQAKNTQTGIVFTATTDKAGLYR